MTITCPHCGKETQDETVCTVCGKSIETSDVLRAMEESLAAILQRVKAESNKKDKND